MPLSSPGLEAPPAAVSGHLALRPAAGLEIPDGRRPRTTAAHQVVNRVSSTGRDSPDGSGCSGVIRGGRRRGVVARNGIGWRDGADGTLLYQAAAGAARITEGQLPEGSRIERPD